MTCVHLPSRCWSSVPALRVSFAKQIEDYAVTSSGVKVSFTDASGNYYEQLERAYRCQATLNLTKSVSCIPTSPERVEVGYAFPSWAAQAAQQLPYEGMTINASNPDQFKQFFKPDEPAKVIENCGKLISQVLFDCEAYSRGQLQCCSKPTVEIKNGKVERNSCVAAGGRVLDGCENGGFYLHVDVDDADIKFSMLRTEVTDNVGNVLRTGSIADKSFDIFINYPLFFYMNTSFEFAKRLLGVGGEVFQGKILLITKGYCYADDDISCAQQFPSQTPGPGGVPYGKVLSPGSGGEKILKEFTKDFAEGNLKSACDYVRGIDPNLTATVFLSGSGPGGTFSDEDPENYANCEEVIIKSASDPKSIFKERPGKVTESTGARTKRDAKLTSKPVHELLYISQSGNAAYIPNFVTGFNFVDTNPARVVGSLQNVFCWSPDFVYGK